jgi:tRNA-dihydrouridine synthase B
VDARVIKKARDHFSGIILANGGVRTHDDAARLLEESGADGIGIARGALGRPWIFKAARTGQSAERSRKAVFKEARKHARLVWNLKGGRGIVEMRKHLMFYVQGLPGAAELRQALTGAENLKDAERILRD